ncbi:hypothetical protein [Sorangium sp. So ce1153]|uniref:hypothetical protein n=1 Tax=Sorangium sp. So ce1153 TaxID=3133333 RepID=UPI003F63C93A
MENDDHKKLPNVMSPLDLPEDIRNALTGSGRARRTVVSPENHPDAKMRSSESKDPQTILIASDDGNIYQLLKEEWTQFDTIQGPPKEWLTRTLLQQGVVVANMPFRQFKPFFTCYLLNLNMIKEPPQQLPPTPSKPK